MNLDDLIVAALAGDSKAWAELGERLTRELEVYFRCRLRDDDVGDIVQTTVLIALRKLPSFQVEAERPFIHWLRSVARNQAIDAYRHRGQQDRLVAGLARVMTTPVTSMGSQLDRVRAVELIREELVALDGRYRRAIVHELEGGDAATLAEREGIKPGSARTRRRRARQRLRSRLRARGLLGTSPSPTLA